MICKVTLKGMQKKNKGLNTAEKKILLVIVMFTIFSIYILGVTSNNIAVSERLTSALTDYFKCEALGHVPGRCNREPIERITTPYFSAISYLLLGLIPLSILNFVFKWSTVKKTKKKLRTFLQKNQSTMTTDNSN